MTERFDWSQVADAWDAHRSHVEQMKQQLTDALVDGLRLEPGASVLELGAGTGELALRLADAVGPSGRVHATDAAAGMVELIARTTRSRPQVTTGVVDATDTGLPAAAYDAVVFRMGLMLLEQPEQALTECRRVLRPGGRLALAVWDAPEHNPWLLALGMSAMMHGVAKGGPPTAPGGVFSLASADQLEKLLAGSGFSEVTVQAVPTPCRFATADEHFETVSALAGPLRTLLAAAPAETLAAVRATAADILAPHRTHDGYVVPGQALLAVGRAGGGGA